MRKQKRVSKIKNAWCIPSLIKISRLNTTTIDRCVARIDTIKKKNTNRFNDYFMHKQISPPMLKLSECHEPLPKIARKASINYDSNNY